MMALENAQRDSFVLLQLAERRFALPAEAVAELAPPVRLHTFPHTSSLIAGVIVRRGRILPVYDAARALSGKSSLAHRFYLVARRQFGEASEMSAIPVDGECELVTSEARPRSESAPTYICSEISLGDESVGVLDIEAFVRAHENPATNDPAEART
ncbi:MAG TPA: chemotaxis protein CheW [Candidatus Acidoferrales bacterium]|nr:chemotaxis protein CheW [Candidatus Acidoferrales bacterium]